MLSFTPSLRNNYVIEVTYNDFNLGEIYCECDGFYVFEPIAERTGYWSDWMLREILEHLEFLNAPHELELSSYFAKQESLSAEFENVLHENAWDSYEA